MDLRVLQDEFMKEFRKVTREKLLPGALIETNFTDEEIVIKDGRKQKPKKIIIIGYDKDNDTYYGSIFINTKINPKAGSLTKSLPASISSSRLTMSLFLGMTRMWTVPE